MRTWTDVFDLQRRSRRNALQAAVTLRRREADAAEAQRSAIAAARSFLDGAHHEPPHRSITPELPVER